MVDINEQMGRLPLSISKFRFNEDVKTAQTTSNQTQLLPTTSYGHLLFKSSINRQNINHTTHTHHRLSCNTIKITSELAKTSF